MVADARSYMFRNPWLVVFPSLGIGLMAVGFKAYYVAVMLLRVKSELIAARLNARAALAAAEPA